MTVFIWTGFVKVILYMAFTLIMVKIHTLPLFAIRPMYLALRWVRLGIKAIETALVN